MTGLQRLPATVPDVENSNYLRLNGEQYAISMPFASVQELSHLERELRRFGSQRTAMRMLGERGDRPSFLETT